MKFNPENGVISWKETPLEDREMIEKKYRAICRKGFISALKKKKTEGAG